MRVLYITYDGLTDFIGQSQVLPYLLGSAKGGHRLTVISFEKDERRKRLGTEVRQLCNENGIDWLPQRFRTNPPYLAKYLDMRTMRRAAMQAVDRQPFDLVHCRSYQAAVVGLAVKRRTGTAMLFDMRGFLPDSRREGGRWGDDRLIGRLLYRRWKSHEARLISAADHIVALTESARHEIEAWPAYRGAPISVVPCCADFDHFTIASKSSRNHARDLLEISPESPVLGYLGSRGTIYMIGHHLRLFAAIRQRDPTAKLVFLGDGDPSDIFAVASQNGVAISADDVRVRQAERSEIPLLLSAMDAGTCFYTPTFSSRHVSPTKLGEYLACGIPVIANRGVGDVEPLIAAVNGGHVLPDFSEESIRVAADAFFQLRQADRAMLRDRSRPLLDLRLAVDAYRSIYTHPSTAVQVGNA